MSSMDIHFGNEVLSFNSLDHDDAEKMAAALKSDGKGEGVVDLTGVQSAHRFLINRANINYVEVVL